MKRILGITLLVVCLSGCAAPARLADVSPTASPATSQEVAPEAVLAATLSPTPLETPLTLPVTPQPTQAAATPDLTATIDACVIDPVVQPPWPVQTLRPNEFDRENSLHMTGKVQHIDLATYELKVTGLVDHPLSLSYDTLRCLPRVTANPELVCPGVFTDQVTWTGTPLKGIVELAGVQKEALQLTLVSGDGYEVTLPLGIAIADGNFLAYELKGKLLPVQHGFPLRAVFPTLDGAKWLKWLVEIKIH